MPSPIDDFKAKLSGGGARNNLFRVTINWPSFTQGDAELSAFLIKAASLPGSTLGEVQIPFRGRTIKFAGDREPTENWSTTIINDTNFAIRNALERWHNRINSNVGNVGTQDPEEYMADLIVEQLDKANNVLKTYTLRGAWPLTISSVELSADTSNNIEEFACDWSYQYWDSDTVN